MNTKTHIDFCVKSNSLQVNQVTNILGLSPTSGFNPNELYMGKARIAGTVKDVQRNRPSFGVWHLSTEGMTNSNSVEDHARFLLETLRSAMPAIQNLLQSSEYEVRVSIWYVGPSGFGITSETMTQLADVCEFIDVRFFDVNECAPSLSDE